MASLAQKKARERFKKAAGIAKKLRQENPAMKVTEATKQAWQIMKKRGLSGPINAASPKKKRAAKAKTPAVVSKKSKAKKAVIIVGVLLVLGLGGWGAMEIMKKKKKRGGGKSGSNSGGSSGGSSGGGASGGYAAKDLVGMKPFGILSKGSRGKRVAAVQAGLVKMGGKAAAIIKSGSIKRNGNYDGIWGDNTSKALRSIGYKHNVIHRRTMLYMMRGVKKLGSLYDAR